MIKREKIYIVHGSVGEYEDEEEWEVAAFRTQQEAHDLIVKAQARAEEIMNAVSALDWKNWHKMEASEDVSMRNDFDPEMVLKYRGNIRYSMHDVPLYGGNYPLTITLYPDSETIGFPAQSGLSLGEACGFRNLLDSFIRDIEREKFAVRSKPKP